MGKQITRRLVSDGMLIGLYVVLTYLSFSIGNFRIGLGALATILVSLLFGPLDGFIVACLGELLMQFIKYGFSLTTPIWILAPAFRGIFIGFIAYLYKKREIDLVDRKIMYFVTILLSSLLVTLINTLALYLDALIVGYPFAFVIVEIISRIGIGLGNAIVLSLIARPIYKGIRGIVNERN